MIEPTVGRVVHYRPKGPDGPIQAAIVTAVHDVHSVSLAVFLPDGDGAYGQRHVPLRQSDADVFTGPYCEWMPYQMGQAKATEQAQHVAEKLAALHEKLLPLDPPVP